MAIEIWNGSSWVTSSDPEIYDAGAWKDVQKGEIYSGGAWSVFYNRITPIAPTLSLSSRTATSITVRAQVVTGSPYKTQVTVYRVGNLPGGNIPATAAVGAIDGTFTESGLAQNTSYTFEAYTTYYDATTNAQVAQSSTTQITLSTLAVTTTAPTLSLNSRTQSTITLNVSAPTGSPYKTQVTVYRTTNPFGGDDIPATAAVGAISGTFTESGLAESTSYTFEAYTTYYDATTNAQVAQSSTTSFVASTSTYTLTVPTPPTNTNRAQFSLTFQSTSNANQSINGTTAVIRFYLEELTGFGWLPASPDPEIDSLSISGDTNTTRSVTFSGLNSGASFRCRAATYWPAIDEISSFSAWSSTVTTTTVTPVQTPYSPNSNRTYFTSASSVVATSTASGSSPSRGSDGSTTTVWYSDPFESSLSTSGNINTPCSAVERSFGVAIYVPSSNFNGTPYDASVASITYIRYAPLRRWTRDFAFGGPTVRYTSIYISGSIAANTSDRINVYGLATGVNGTGLTIDSIDTYGSYTRVTLITPSATLAGTESSPVLVSASYCTFTTFRGTSVSTLAFATKLARSESDTTELWITDSRTPNLTPRSTSNGSITYRYRFYAAKPVDGTETLTLNFAVNTTTYPNARMLTTDGIYVLNDTSGSQTFTIQKQEDGGGGNAIWTPVTTATLASGGSNTYNSGGLQLFDIAGTKYFSFRIVCDRHSVSGAGNIATIKEVSIRFTYDTTA